MPGSNAAPYYKCICMYLHRLMISFNIHLDRRTNGPLVFLFDRLAKVQYALFVESMVVVMVFKLLGREAMATNKFRNK